MEQEMVLLALWDERKIAVRRTVSGGVVAGSGGAKTVDQRQQRGHHMLHGIKVVVTF